jgi:hypothetical protein
MGRRKIIRTQEEILERRRVLAKKTAEWRKLNPEKAKELDRRQNAKAQARRKKERESMSEDQIAEIKSKHNEYMRERRSKNPEKHVEQARKYRSANPEKSRQATRRWADANRKKIAEADHKRNQKAETKQRRNAARREKIRKADLYALECRCRNRTYYAFRAFGFRKTSRTAELLGADWPTVRDHIESQFVEGMTWENRSLWHIDHIIPIASATDQDHLHRLCHYTNLQPLWIEENMKKSSRLDYQRKPQSKKPQPQWAA